jgi:hypothetical protein
MAEVLNLHQLAERLGLSVDWLREQADAGRLPCLRAANRILFNPIAVTQALAEMASAGPQPKPKRTKREGAAHAHR